MITIVESSEPGYYRVCLWVLDSGAWFIMREILTDDPERAAATLRRDEHEYTIGTSC